VFEGGCNSGCGSAKAHGERVGRTPYEWRGAWKGGKMVASERGTGGEGDSVVVGGEQSEGERGEEAS
jgi:hypothetical protein